MVKPIKYSFLVICIFMAVQCCYANENYVLVGWNDSVVWGGPGTDAAFDSPQAIERVMKRWKGRGFTGVYWRIDQMVEGDPNLRCVYDEGILPGTAEILHILRTTMAQFPVSQTAREKAEAEGLTFWAWSPIVYSRGAPVSGPGITFPWMHQDRYLVEHPEAMFVNRAGTKTRYMLSEFTYSEARSSKVAEFQYYANQWGFKNFLVCMRTEDYQNQAFPDDADEFGFNQSVVYLMQTLYGVNILTDSRFDVFSPTFNRTDTMVENWRVLRGTYLTQFYRELRSAMNTIDPGIKISVQIPGGDYVGPTIGNIKLDWRTWINEGLINELVIPVNLSDYADPNAKFKGYLTNNQDGTGILPASTFRNFIDSSSYPQTRLIHAGGPYFQFVPPPAGTDGWRTDGTTDLYYLGWYQRWEQLKKDIQEFGYIKFIEQNFDGFTVNDDGISGGWGRSKYQPILRKCEGLWQTFGNGSDCKPVVQNSVRHGSTGNAVKLTRSGDASASIAGRHVSVPGRGMCSDNSIFSGTCTLEFWLYRQETSSAVGASVQYSSAGGYPIGIYVAPGTDGIVSFLNNGYWIATSKKMGTGVWQKFVIDANLETSTYSAYMGTNKEFPLCRNVPYSTSINTFDQVIFSPQGSTGTVVYLDDVSWKWCPAQVYGNEGITKFLVDGFDSHTVDATVHNTLPDSGSSVWTVSSSTYYGNYFTENDLSYGDGYKCLAAKKASVTVSINSGMASTIPLNADYVISAQWDMWLSANSGASINLKKIGTSLPIAAVKAESGKWWYYADNAYVDSGKTYNTADTIWYHLQLWLNGADKTYKLILQPLGEKPVIVAGSIPWNASALNTDRAVFEISPLGSTNTITYFDNISVTYGLPDLCGGTGKTKPVGDLNNDCTVDFSDMLIFNEHWLEEALWQ